MEEHARNSERPASGERGWLRKLFSLLAIVNARLRFIYIMLAIGLVVGYWDAIKNVYDRWTRPASAPDMLAAQSDVEYYCPMHPFIVRLQPGKCPVCGMPLSKRKKGVKVELPKGVVARVSLLPDRVEQAGVASTPIDYRVLVHEIRTVGVLSYDERRQAKITAWVAGRADKVYVDFTGTTVGAGQPLVSLYSPELVSTQEEYLAALGRPPAASATARGFESSLAAAARRRLELWGIKPEQIDRIARQGKAQTHMEIRSPIGGTVTHKDVLEGQYVDKGKELFDVADLSALWLMAYVYEDDISWLKLGQAVEIQTESFPGEIFVGSVSFLQPELDTATRTLRVRIDVPNAGGRLRPGMYATATVRVPLGPSYPATSREAKELLAKEGPSAPSTPNTTIYTCLMHPEVRSTKPGRCPKCGMTLVPVRPQPSRHVALVCPMHPDAEPDADGRCPKCGSMMLTPGEAARRTIVGTCCPLHPDEVNTAACPVCHVPCQSVVMEKTLAVPESSVIDTGTRKLVYLDRGGGVFDAVEVTLGPRSGSYYPVLSGLAAGDRVLTAGSFLIDAEARLSAGLTRPATPPAESASPELPAGPTAPSPTRPGAGPTAPSSTPEAGSASSMGEAGSAGMAGMDHPARGGRP